MGRSLGYHDSDELDRPELNKCPDCECYFASEACPLCGKICPEEFRAGNRAKVKPPKKRGNSSGRVRFIAWYHSWWFILLMFWFMPIVGIVLLVSSPHEKWKKWTAAGVLAVLYLISWLGIGGIVSVFTNLFDRPVDTSLTYEQYVAECDELTAEQYYRSYAEYEDDFVTLELKVLKKAMFTDISGYDEYTYYICTPVDGSEYYIILRDCLISGEQALIPGDTLTVYGQGDIYCKAFDTDQSIYQGPCLNMAYMEFTE